MLVPSSFRRAARLASSIAAVLCASSMAALHGADPSVRYRLVVSPDDRTLAVEAVFEGVEDALELHMSRASPGRYALHDFARNVFALHAADAAGKALELRPLRPDRWRIAAPGSGTVHVTYRVFGDRVDGTYLAVDRTHAHVNMPAALVWSPAFRRAPVQLEVEPPAGARWRVATQLYPTANPLAFTAPNLDYLMDSPLDASAGTWRTFEGGGPPDAAGRRAMIALAVHHAGTEEDVDTLSHDLEQIAAEEASVFGEYPAYEPGRYTFVADYLPWASGDGMEHRNSTVLTSSASIAGARDTALAAAAHEFFHGWNVERIRPRTLEPFDFDDENMTGELWLAEGVTNYYGALALRRAGLTSTADFLTDLGRQVNEVLVSPGTRLRSPVDMSRMAPLVDGAHDIDRSNLNLTFVSYYFEGAALGLGLDLAIREHTGSRRTLDDFMRAMWQYYGRADTTRPGIVPQPYGPDDVRARLAEVVGDAAFAGRLVDEHIAGTTPMDYARLLGLAGVTLRPAFPGQASLGLVAIERSGSQIQVGAPVPPGSPAAEARLAQDDVIEAIDGRAITSVPDLADALRRHRPGDRATLTVRYRGAAAPERVTVRLVEDPRIELVANEDAGLPYTSAQRAFREAWLATRVR